MNTSLYWIVKNRQNDIVIASFAIWEDANDYAKARNKLRPELESPWFITKN